MSATANLDRPLQLPPLPGTTPGAETTLAGTAAHAAGRGRRSWALAGVAAAVASGASLVASGAFGAGVGEDGLADSAALAPLLADQRGALAVFIATATVGSLLLLVFAAGLRRRLDGQCAPGSLLPSVAASGLALCAALVLVGAGIGTELFWGLGDLTKADSDAIQSMYHLVATFSWVWAGAGLSAAAIAVAALRHAALPKWIGWASAVGAVGMLGFSVIPLQYMSGMVGVLWLLAVSIGLSVSRERSV